MNATATRRFGRAIVSGILSLALLTGLAAAPQADAKPLTPRARNTGVVTAPDGYKVHYWEYGPSVRKAPTIFFTGTYPWHSGVFEPVIRFLANKYHVVRYDARGFGQSDHPYLFTEYALEKLAEEFGAVVDHVLPPKKKFHVFGMEWGAFTYSEYNFRHPGRIVSFTSIGFPSIDIAELHYRDTMKNGSLDEKIEGTEFKAQALGGTMVANDQVIADLVLAGVIPLANVGSRASMGDFQGDIALQDAILGRRTMMANMLQRQITPRYNFLDVPLLQAIEMESDPFPTAFTLKGMHRYTNRFIYRRLDTIRTLLTTYPMTLANWTHVAVQAGERIEATV